MSLYVFLSIQNIDRSTPLRFMILYDPSKFLTRLRLGLSHPNEHRFSHNFSEVELSTHFFLHRHHFNQFHQTLLDSVKKIVNDISTDDTLVQTY